MATYEHRVCRNLESDTTRNTLDLNPGPTFGVLELLDSSDSRYFANFLLKKRWREITPPAHKKAKTYYHTRPSEEELREFESMVPDWFYISGHYARTTTAILDDEGKVGALQTLPAGFFNEPFHVNEWESEWNVRSAKSLFLQTEILPESREQTVRDYWDKHWLRSPYGPGAHLKTKPDPKDKEAVVKAWWDIWTKPQDDVVLGGSTHAGVRGLLTAPLWNDVKVVLLVGCNTLAWPRTVLNSVFPNALILGYIHKNPANATPHIRAFLTNLFRDLRDRRDPRLFDHEFIAKAWTDVHRRQRPTKSRRMAYMDTSGKLFGWKGGTDLTQIGGVDEIINVDIVDPSN